METVFTRMLAGATDTWLPVVYAAGAILIVAYRPQQIASPGVFRVSYLAFAAHLLVMPLCNLITYSVGPSSGMPLRMDSTGALITHVGAVVSRGLFAISIVALLSSMVSEVTDD